MRGNHEKRRGKEARAWFFLQACSPMKIFIYKSFILLLIAMLNGSVFGQRFYGARNPPWTAHKPTMGLRANGQIKGKLGHGDQRYVRKAFALTGIKNFGMHGFALINGKMTPKPAAAMMQNLKAAYRSYPQIAVGQQAQEAKKQAMAQAAHRASVARWEGGSTEDYFPGGAMAPDMAGYENY